MNKQARLPVLAVMTGSSNSGRSCVEELVTRYAAQFAKVKVGFRSEEKAAELRSAPYFSASKIDVVVGVDADKQEALLDLFAGVDCALVVTPLDHSRGYGRDAELSNQMILAAHAAGVKHGKGWEGWEGVRGRGCLRERERTKGVSLGCIFSRWKQVLDYHLFQNRNGERGGYRGVE